MFTQPPLLLRRASHHQVPPADSVSGSHGMRSCLNKNISSYQRDWSKSVPRIGLGAGPEPLPHGDVDFQVAFSKNTLHP